MTLNFDKIGIGTDIEDISRFTKILNNQHFLNKVYSKKELEYCLSKKKPEQHLAARFTGKEAIIKALNSINKPWTNYKKIEILNNKKGIPTAKLIGETNNLKIKISLSHSKDKALAFAVIKKETLNE